MATIKIILYSIENSKRIVFRDVTEVLASEIEQTYYHNCEVKQFRTGGARVLVNERAHKALFSLGFPMPILKKRRYTVNLYRQS